MKFENLRNAFNVMVPTSGLVCSADDDPPAGGGDGGDPPAAPAIDEKKLANMVNSAVTGHLKRLDFSGMISSGIGEAMKSFQPPTPAAPETPAPGDKPPSAAEIELAKMKTEQKVIREKLEATENAAAAEKQKAVVQQERSSLTNALRKGGVDDARLGAASAYLYLDQKLIERDEDGNICMRFKREWGPELLPIDEGIVEYLGTDEGKVFLPPVDVSGSGNKGGRPPARRPGEKPSRGELMTHLGKQLFGAIE